MPIGIEDFNIEDATVRITNWRNLRRIDWFLPLVTMMLVAVGWAVLYSACRNIDIGLLHRQVGAFFVGVLLAAFIIAIDYRFMVASAPLFYALCVGVLALVTLFGEEKKGAERWLAIMGVGIQPSEFAKVSMVYFLTWYLTTLGDRVRRFHWFALTFVLAGIPAVLILKQPNLGTAATLFPLTFVMLYVAGCRVWHLGLVVLAGLSVAPLVWLQMKDFDPAFYVMDADVSGKIEQTSAPGSADEAASGLQDNKDGVVSWEEFGLEYGIPQVPESQRASFAEADLAALPGRRKCKLLLAGTRQDASLVIRAVPNAEGSWLTAAQNLVDEGCTAVGLLYNPEFRGLARLDADSNGFLTEQEFMALDKNRDGKISSEDKGAFDLKHYQKKRIYTFLNQDEDVDASGWQTYQSKISVGSGGLNGKGYTNGTQTRLNYLPEHHTDFIFSVLAEEEGFVGVAVVIGLFGVFLLRGLSFAREAPEMMGTLLATGVVTVLAFHVFVNIAITVGLMPVTGIPLPFLSYGRSFYLTTMACVGVLLNVPMRKNIFVNQ
ncbi:MAG: rod shape-determining protein RodA [Candidatus Hydrogenedentes bacterium]|nr:rod shape-determining protein RodA [Candidatus Hydrogenedentota bacterium]